MYYLYQLINPNTKLPFYIGVAKKDRKNSCTREQQHIREALAWSKGRKIKSANKHKFNTILKILKEHKEVPIKTGPTFENEVDAFNLEVTLIKKYGRDNLTNLTDGGEGVVNPSAETRLKHSIALKGRASPLKGRKVGPYTEAHRKAISEARRGYKVPEEVKQKLRGKTPWNKGMKFEYQERPNAKGRIVKSSFTKGNVPWNKGKKLGPTWAWNKGKTSLYKGKTWRLQNGKRVWYTV